MTSRSLTGEQNSCSSGELRPPSVIGLFSHVTARRCQSACDVSVLTLPSSLDPNPSGPLPGHHVHPGPTYPPIGKQEVLPPLPLLSPGLVLFGPWRHSNNGIPLVHEAGCRTGFCVSPLGGGLARLGSAVLQRHVGDPLVPAATLVTEAADVLQGRTLQWLHRGVLHRTGGESRLHRAPSSQHQRDIKETFNWR